MVASWLHRRLQMPHGYADLPTSFDRKTGDAHAEEGAAWARSAALMEGWGIVPFAGATSELDDHTLAHEGRSICE